MLGNTSFGFSGAGGGTPPPVSNGWLLNGNAEGAEKYFGTNDNFSIPIYTNGSAIGVFTNTGDFGFGTISPTSRVHIVGVDSTSSNYSLKIDNSAFSPLLYIQNDGYIGVGTASPNALMDIVAANATPFAFSIRNSTHTANTTFGYKIYQENSGYMTFYMDGAKYMSISPNGIVSYSKSSYTSPDTQLISQAFAAGNASYGFYCRGYLSNNGLSVDGDGNVGINQLTATAKLHIKGINSISSNYALKVDNSTLTSLLYARNDGEIGMNGFTIRQLASATYFKTSGTNGYLFNNASDSTNLGKISNTGQILFGDISDANYVGIGIAIKSTALTSDLTKEYNAAFFKNNTDQDGVYFSSKQGFAYIQTYAVTAGVNQTLVLGGRGAGTVLETMFIDNNSNVGIGIPSPAAKLHIKGSDATSSNYALKIDNSASSPLFYVTNSSRIIINGTSSNSPSGVDTAIFTSNLSGYTFQHAANITWLYDNNVKMFNAIGADYGTVGTFTAHDFYIRTNNVDRIFINSTGNVGIGIPSPAAKLHIKGADATSANYALKVDNSASSPLLYVRNDGSIGMGVSPTNNRVTIQDAGGVNSQLVITSGSGATSFLAFSAGNQQLYFDAVYYGSAVIAKHTTATGILSLTDQLRFCGNTGLTVGNSFSYNTLMNIDITTGNMSLGLGASNGFSRFHNFGIDATTKSNQRLEPVANVTEDTTGNTVNTADATANVTAQTIAVPTDKVISIESTIVYRKTSGAGVGTTGDGTTIKLNSSVKNVGGTLTLDTVQNTYTGTTNAIVGVSATYTISGTNVLVSVTGVLNDNITWNVITKVNTVA